MASTQTHVDQPLCVDCAAQLKDEVEAQVNTTVRVGSWMWARVRVGVCT